ncbi:hypothetical protein T05_452 [Trichinella murrelli]|uniref:Uncharacterized protein n=1 Tax=Trichinella murrelli TaxID=144512 RepID=A0A0V0T0X4_9BILA|nr:hypothetical protein T05_9957 [Trichinella murrelli]KRX34555.1 hypothetical protein T05_452 [Trichinella murrelli]
MDVRRGEGGEEIFSVDSHSHLGLTNLTDTGKWYLLIRLAFLLG